ncbi:MAG: adenosylmethionine--8-amino-7-oxononanoate transaminase [Acidimicrobiales bacterium]
MSPRSTHDPSTLAERDRATVWHPYAPMPASTPPLPVAGASGVHLHLTDGRRVIDGMSSWWAAIHGYRHPDLDAAVRDQLDSMAHVMFGGLTHAPAVELCELLVELAPGELRHVFLADSGSVSVEVAIKMAIQYWAGVGRPQRRRLLTVRSGYHGDTLGAMSVCDPVTGMHQLFGDVVPSQIFAPAPEPAFDREFTPSHIADLDDLLIAHCDEIAAVILEPVVQGAGGMRFYSPDYLAAVRTLCDRHDVLLIADEIATGFGRSGTFFGCDHAGIAPDIMCLGKALTGGYMTLAATLCTPRVAEGVSLAESGALMHGPTFMANPLACAVALASVRLLVSRPWHDEVAAIEAGLRRGLDPLRSRPGVRDVRVLGAIGVVELDGPIDMGASQATLLDHGVWLRPFGRLLYTMPPYICGADEIDAITAAMAAVVDRLA